jgi:hypothetical protein
MDRHKLRWNLTTDTTALNNLAAYPDRTVTYTLAT